MNQCFSCGEDFGSVSAFDAHRIGLHDYLYSAEHPNGRRCLTIEEMAADEGFAQNARGAWSLTRDLERARSLSERNPGRHTAIPEAA